MWKKNSTLFDMALIIIQNIVNDVWMHRLFVCFLSSEWKIIATECQFEFKFWNLNWMPCAFRASDFLFQRTANDEWAHCVCVAKFGYMKNVLGMIKFQWSMCSSNCVIVCVQLKLTSKFNYIIQNTLTYRPASSRKVKWSFGIIHYSPFPFFYAIA